MTSVSQRFQYDPFGRRVSTTIGGTTQFLYDTHFASRMGLQDGTNPVQELPGSSAAVNLLAGGVDEYFQRTASVGAGHFLTDAFGSALALSDSAGALQTQQTFERFVNTTVTGTGTATTNILTASAQGDAI